MIRQSLCAECPHCENSGEMTYASFQREQQKHPTKVWMKNIPQGMSGSGLKNLFLTIGQPLAISFNPRGRFAIIEFNSLNEVELAIRDLHYKPPYNLKVTKEYVKPKTDVRASDAENGNKLFGQVIQLGRKGGKSFQEYDVRNGVIGDSEIECKMRDLICKIGYNPSLRLRQEVMDIKTDLKCIYRGRGFINLGNKDRFVGSSQKFEFSAQYSKAKDEMSFYCGTCEALTTKHCGSCRMSFCSKMCLQSSILNHDEKCSRRISERKLPLESNGPSTNPCPKDQFQAVSLESGCVVVLASYFTMRTVYVRPHSKMWEERFSSLMNYVAEEAVKGKKLDRNPKLHDLVIARYYEDLCFYRAQVCDVTEDKITILFIDFGNTQETHLEDLRYLPPHHLTAVPGLAVKALLKDVSELSSQASVKYFNHLTADSVPLILNFSNSANEVILVEKNTGTEVNKTLFQLSQPSWKKDDSVLYKSGEVFYLNAIRSQKMEVGKSYNLTLSHFDEKEFLESEVFWMINQDTDEFLHASLEMLFRVTEYCEFLKDDHYLPRTNELCLAKENEKWHRCVNLKSHQTTCCLFFLDDGHSSLVNTASIRKMVQDFTETPSQAICCTLPHDGRLKEEKEFQTEVIDYLKSAIGQKISFVRVLKQMGDAYCLSIPEMNDMSMKIENTECN